MKSLEGPFLKPLLRYSKETLRQYLNHNNLTWYEDLSNEKRTYSRNKVRLDIIPELSDLAGGNGALQTRLFEWVDQSNDVKDLIEIQVCIGINIIYNEKSNLKWFYCM